MTSQEFKTIRQQLGLTQAELAETMGMTPQAVSRIERGERQPTLQQAEFINHIKETDMKRIALEDGGWFNEASAVKFGEATYWNGNNHISTATGSQWEHEALFYTKSGSWVLNEWSQRQGSRETYEKISEARAIAWLIKNDCADEISALPSSVQASVQAGIAAEEV